MMRQPDRPESVTTKETREAFFARVVQEHARFLYRVAASVLRQSQDAEDAVQDALLKLYRGESWRNMMDERAFLARVVWRAALNRKSARVEAAEEGAEYRVVDERATPEAALAEGDERALLQEWINELAAELREPLVLSALEEMNSRRVGEVMGLPEGTVRTRLMRARAELRAKWQAMQAKQVVPAGTDTQEMRDGGNEITRRGAAVS